MMNRKGFVLEGVMVLWAVVALTIGAVTIFQGPNLMKAVTGNDKDKAKQTLKVSESYPIGHLDQKGNFVKIGDYKKSEDRLNITSEKPTETLWEKFWHLGWMAVIIIGIIAGIITYLGAWGWFRNKVQILRGKLAISETEKADLNADAKLIVQSVDAGLQTIKDSKAIADAVGKLEVSIALDKARKDFLTAMDGVQDTSTKVLVHDLLKND